MPTYEYACPRGHRFERFVRKISDAEAAPACPECGVAAARLISGGGALLFKGSGFYITDYGKDGKKRPDAAPVKADAGTSDAPAAPGAKSESPKGDSPASAPASKTDSPPPSKPKGGE